MIRKGGFEIRDFPGQPFFGYRVSQRFDALVPAGSGLANIGRAKRPHLVCRFDSERPGLRCRALYDSANGRAFPPRA